MMKDKQFTCKTSGRYLSNHFLNDTYNSIWLLCASELHHERGGKASLTLHFVLNAVCQGPGQLWDFLRVVLNPRQSLPNDFTNALLHSGWFEPRRFHRREIHSVGLDHQWRLVGEFTEEADYATYHVTSRYSGAEQSMALRLVEKSYSASLPPTSFLLC